MVMMRDMYGKYHECKSIQIDAVPQPSTKEMFWGIMAIGYDGIRRTTLYLLPDEKELKKKFAEVQREYIRIVKVQFSEYS
jgi:hypothetical protein